MIQVDIDVLLKSKEALDSQVKYMEQLLEQIRHIYQHTDIESESILYELNKVRILEYRLREKQYELKMMIRALDMITAQYAYTENKLIEQAEEDFVPQSQRIIRPSFDIVHLRELSELISRVFY